MRALVAVTIAENKMTQGSNKIAVQIYAGDLFNPPTTLFVPRDRVYFLDDERNPPSISDGGPIIAGDTVLVSCTVMFRRTHGDEEGDLVVRPDWAEYKERLIDVPMSAIGEQVQLVKRAIHTCGGCANFYEDNKRASCGQPCSPDACPLPDTIACEYFER